MENLVVLAAVAATLIGCVLMAGLFWAGRRTRLMLPQEEDWADDEAGTIRKLTPDSQSPIDRNAAVLDVKALDQAPELAAIDFKTIDARTLDAELNRLMDRARSAEPEQAGPRRQAG
ncbi:hypothetical protein ASG52_03115 [Methylobacterium sp. Leaf456]|uniref:hypothetical protein n=1 Tax=Methylobacterium sp. Leaf456 TaxID=1736382 RepID=UPI0006F72F8B|nr:hypothetical protein [Methylobacterium sp. Leaf456]KQT57077.1 hypothetical protein ASG52_03115 [Methylobacterium sp. Leaf456]